MANDIQIIKTVHNKTEFSRVIDKGFKTYTQPVLEEDTDTPEELFRLYEKLYYVIDIEGEENSHEYLIKQSSAYIGFQQENEDIQALLDEIASLRQENLDLLKQQLPSS